MRLAGKCQPLLLEWFDIQMLTTSTSYIIKTIKKTNCLIWAHLKSACSTNDNEISNFAVISFIIQYFTQSKFVPLNIEIKAKKEKKCIFGFLLA